MPSSENTSSHLGIYNAGFYADQINGSVKSASIVIPSVLELFPDIASVVDFGCGAGSWLSVFKHLGVPSVVGLDGGSAPDELLLIDKSEYREVDLTREHGFNERADLAMTLEVAEHLDEKHAAVFVANLCHTSDLILFSAAMPEQGGLHHVNERWPSYWVDLFAAHNYQFFDVIRSQHWFDARVEWWYRQNIFMVANGSRADLVERLEQAAQATPPLLDCVHPDMYLAARRQTQARAQEAAKLRAQLHTVMNSRSWKLMKIPRGLVRRFNKLFAKSHD